MKWRTSYFPEGGTGDGPVLAYRSTPKGSTPDPVAHLLEFARRHLGMDVALVGEFVNEDEVYRAVSGDRSRIRVHPGSSIGRANSYCQLVVDGKIPFFIPDARNDPRVSGLSSTGELGIGSFIGVPVLTSDGRLYGALCCLSAEPNPGLSDSDAQFLEVIADLAAEALEGRELELRDEQEATKAVQRLMAADACRTVFQPLKDLWEDSVVGYEALSRFDQQQVRNPEQLFNLAWSRGLGSELELHAVRTAVRSIPLLPGDAYVALNVSPQTIVEGGLREALEGAQMDHLVLEITEHAPVQDYDELARCLKPFRDEGMFLAIDDAGAGYASLRHILRLDPDAVKIDASLTRNIDEDPRLLALAAALISFCSGIGATVVAEGIETEREEAALRELGIRYAQGFHIGPPASAESLSARLNQMGSKASEDQAS